MTNNTQFFLQLYVIQNRFLHYKCKNVDILLCIVIIEILNILLHNIMANMTGMVPFCQKKNPPPPQIIVLINQSLDQDQCKI